MKRNKILDEAQRAIERQQYDRAIRAYRNLLVDTPNDLQIRLKLAELYLRIRHMNTAIEHYHQIADHYIQIGDEQRAASVYNLVVKISQNDVISRSFLLKRVIKNGTQPEAEILLWELVKAYDSSGESDKSWLVLNQVFTHFPTLLEVRSAIVERSLERGQNDIAGRHLDYLFKVLTDISQEDQRVQIGERLVNLNMASYDVKFILSSLYLKRGAAHLAVRGLQELFKVNPSDLDVLMVLGKALNQLGFRSKALKALNSVIFASNSRKEFERAKSAAELVLTIDPRHQLAQSTLSTQSGDHSATQSIKHIKIEAVEHTQKDDLSSQQNQALRLAHDHLLAGRANVAFDLIRQVLELEATHRAALELLRDTAKALGNQQLYTSVNEAIDEVEGKVQTTEKPLESSSEPQTNIENTHHPIQNQVVAENRLELDHFNGMDEDLLIGILSSTETTMKEEREAAELETAEREAAEREAAEREAAEREAAEREAAEREAAEREAAEREAAEREAAEREAAEREATDLKAAVDFFEIRQQNERSQIKEDPQFIPSMMHSPSQLSSKLDYDKEMTDLHTADLTSQAPVTAVSEGIEEDEQEYLANQRYIHSSDDTSQVNSSEFSIIPIENEFDDHERSALFTEEELPILEQEVFAKDQEQSNQRMTSLDHVFNSVSIPSLLPTASTFVPSPSTRNVAETLETHLSVEPNPLSVASFAGYEEFSLEARQRLIQEQRDSLKSSQEQMGQNAIDVQQPIKPSARERAKAESDKESLDDLMQHETFTPAPIHLGKEMSPHKTTSLSHSLSASNSLGATTFTPLPLGLRKQKSSGSLFPKPKENIEIDRSKHLFDRLVNETELPSPLLSRSSFNLSDHAQNKFEQLPFEDITDHEIHEVVLDHLIDDLMIDGAEILDELNYEAPPPVIEANLLGNLDDISNDFEEAFGALQTPLPSVDSVLQSSSSTYEEHFTKSTDNDYSFTDIEWRRLLVFDSHHELSTELLELTEMYIVSGQFEMALDQLALSLLSPNPAKVILYLQAIAMCKIGNRSESRAVLETLFAQLPSSSEPTVVEGKIEVLVKLIGIYQHQEEVDELNLAIERLQELAPQVAAMIYDMLDEA